MNADAGDESRARRLTPPFVRRSETPTGAVSGERVVQPPFARPRGTTGDHPIPVEPVASVEPIRVSEQLPSIAEYLYAPQAASPPEPPAAEPAPPRRTPENIEASGSWVLGEWQRLEAQRTSTATAEADSELAREAWRDLDWEEDAGLNRRKRPAEMVAVILDRVARRIRAGEIRVAGTPGMSEEAALAAALSALLGVRRP